MATWDRLFEYDSFPSSLLDTVEFLAHEGNPAFFVKRYAVVLTIAHDRHHLIVSGDDVMAQWNVFVFRYGGNGNGHQISGRK